MKLNVFIRNAFCAAAACAVKLCSASAYATLTPESAAAYQGVIDDLAGQYGNVRVDESSGQYLGLACARLIDFDSDDMPELYCAYGVPNEYKIHQVLYTYDNGLIRLDIPDAVSNFSTDVAPSTRIFTGLGKAYLVDGHEVMKGTEVRYLTKQGHQMVTALTYIAGFVSGQQPRRVNNENVSADGLKRALNTFTLNMTGTDYGFVRGGDGADPTATIKPTLDEIRSRTELYAAPATAHLAVQDNRTEVMKEARFDVAAYAINGNHYLKLRDLAAALNGSPRQFAVGWDGQSTSIRISTGRHYSRTGSELGAPPTAAAQAERAASVLLIDGQPKYPTTYIIAQSHYYRLRDLAEYLNLTVSWNPRTKTATLTPR